MSLKVRERLRGGLEETKWKVEMVMMVMVEVEEMYQ